MSTVPPFLEHTPQSPWASDFKGFQSPHHRRGWRWSAGLRSHQLGLPPE